MPLACFSVVEFKVFFSFYFIILIINFVFFFAADFSTCERENLFFLHDVKQSDTELKKNTQISRALCVFLMFVQPITSIFRFSIPPFPQEPFPLAISRSTSDLFVVEHVTRGYHAR